jgi:hypothetical protein
VKTQRVRGATVAAKQAAESTSTKSKAKKKQQKDKVKGKRAWKALGSGSALVAGFAMTKALDATWRTATGRKPPTKPENPEIAGREAILWAALSGMAIGVAKTYATRRAANYWIRSTGELPPGMKDKASKADKKRMKKQAAAGS